MRIAILGNRNDSYLPHYSLDQCLEGLGKSYDLITEWVPTENLESGGNSLSAYDGIIAGSGPYRSKAGILNGIRFAREHNIPFLGTCSGFQYAILEFAQSIYRLKEVFHPEEPTDSASKWDFLQGLNVCGIGIHTIEFAPVKQTLTSSIYNNSSRVYEESHCSFGISADQVPNFEKSGLIVSAYDNEGEPKIMEYAKNDFFIITLFLPQLKCANVSPHPLIEAFLKSIKNRFFLKKYD